MAKNKPYGDNRREGAVRQRSQVQMHNGHWGGGRLWTFRPISALPAASVAIVVEDMVERAVVQSGQTANLAAEEEI
jgi:hypothetical protein